LSTIINQLRLLFPSFTGLSETSLFNLKTIKKLLQNIPFNKPLYLKVLGPVCALVAFIFAVAVLGFGYEFTTADPIGAPIACLLLAYFFHLALWNPAD